MDAPVFIVGQARSGSTVLYRLLLEHPRFQPRDGLNLTESHLMDRVADAPDLDVKSLRRFASLTDEGWASLRHQLRSVERRRRVAVRVRKGLLVRSVALWSALGCRATVRAYVAASHEARGAARLVEKTPQNLRWGRHLLHAFPDARLLVITRHPVAAYASFRRRAAEDPSATWAALTPAQFARRWRAEVDHLAALVSTASSQVRLERYERLVADPDDLQRSLFDWLGEPPLDALPASVPVRPGSPKSDPQLFDEVRDLGRDWSRYVSVAEAQALEAALAGPMSRLGYSAVTSATPP